MTTDNRANEPTEAQVEAAAKALRADEGFMEEVHSALEVSWSEYIARLVLVAAQGAAPQAGQCGARWLRENGSENVPPGDWRCALPLDHGGPHVDGADGTRWGRHRDHGGVPGDAVGTFFPPTGAAPVLPSSGVDEEKLAEVIAKSRGFGNGWTQIPPLTREAYREVARAVAEWLKGQGRGTEM